MIECNLSIKISTEGVHSGDASGVVPDTFRILRMVTELVILYKNNMKFQSFWTDLKIL